MRVSNEGGKGKMKGDVSPGWEYPNGIFYHRAREMMGIDPDNNPNYQDTNLYDLAGNPIKITVDKSPHLIPMSQLFEHMCKRLSDSLPLY